MSEAKNVTPIKPKDTKPNFKYLRDKDREMVSGIFRFHEVPGGTMSFVFKGHAGDPVERFDMVDGQVYNVPLGVARHLNKNLWYPQHAYSVDENGKPIAKITQKIRRCSFQSLQFVDTDDITPTGIVEVTKA